MEPENLPDDLPCRGDSFTCKSCGMALVCCKDCDCGTQDCPVLQCCGNDLVKS